MLTFCSVPFFGMHIMEGFLPMHWALGWSLLCLPFLLCGLRSIRQQTNERPNLKLLLAMVGAFAFVLSALKLPSVTGSCSHPTGVALGAILFGPTAMSVMGALILLFQALLLAHGGLTTLGANIMSMAVAGPMIAYGVFRLCRVCRLHLGIAVCLAAFCSDLGTYIITSLQLAMAFPDPAGGVAVSLVKFLGIFAITQIPLAIVEGLLSVVVFNLLLKYSSSEIESLGFIQAQASQSSCSEVKI